MADLETAKAAKRTLAAQLAGDERISGIGISVTGGDYSVKINLVGGQDMPTLPEEFDGVPVTTAVTGRVRALS